MDFMIFLLVCAVIALFFYIREQAKTLQQLARRLGEMEKVGQGPGISGTKNPLVSSDNSVSAPTKGQKEGETAKKSPTPAGVVAIPAVIAPRMGAQPQKKPAATAEFRNDGGNVPPPASGPSPSVSPALPFLKNVNFEQFLGVKLFAWIGGLVLFLAVVFFIKYSFDQGYVGPKLRIALGYLLALALTTWGVILSRGRFEVAGKSLAGAGILILYGITMAAHGLYQLIPTTVAFAIMSLNTGAALVLSVVLSAPSIAVLGFLGGFLTPPLLSTGEDRPFTLFAYIALLDLGLILVAMRKRWALLILLGSVATVFMLWGWAGTFLTEAKMPLAMGLFLGFHAFFSGLAYFLKRTRFESITGVLGTLIPAVSSIFLIMVLFANHQQNGGYGHFTGEPWMLFAFILGADLLVFGAVNFQPRYRDASNIMGSLVLILLTWWMGAFLRAENLIPALAMILAVGALHTTGPLYLEKREKSPHSSTWIQMFALAGFLLFLFPLMGSLAGGIVVWPFVLFMTLLVLGIGMALKNARMIVIAFVATFVLALTWVFAVPMKDISEWAVYGVILGFVAVFAMVATVLLPRIQPRQPSEIGSKEWIVLPVSAVMPAFLLLFATLRLSLESPHVIMGAVGIYVAILLTVARILPAPHLALSGLVALLLVTYSWAAKNLSPANAGASMAWILGLSSLLFLHPFLFFRRSWDLRIPWISTALVFPLTSFLVLRCGHLLGWTSYPGLVPVVMALPLLLAWGLCNGQTRGMDLAVRNRNLALFGGATLFFLTIAIPVQFRREWITVGWALEGTALLWYFTRVPHPGLKWTGLALLALVFIRLTMNPWVFDYHPRTEKFFFNHYLYTYGVPMLSLGLAAWFSRGMKLWGTVRTSAVLGAMGGILALLLMNIEIADYFSTGSHLTFRFSGSLGQDMAYSIAWGLFSTGVLVVGFRLKHSMTRYVGLALLVLTLLKLFLHDLFRLGGLYRIGSLIGLALVLIALSFAYARFFSGKSIDESK